MQRKVFYAAAVCKIEPSLFLQKTTSVNSSFVTLSSLSLTLKQQKDLFTGQSSRSDRKSFNILLRKLRLEFGAVPFHICEFSLNIEFL